MDGVPPWISPTFAVVPPMSNEMTSSLPITLPRFADAMTPAAGPDSTMKTGFRAAAPAPNTPPLDCITSSSAETPASARRRSMFSR